MKKSAFVLLILLCFSITESYSQNIYGFVDNYFVSFNLQDKTKDTLITFSGNPWINIGFRAAIDRFNGRYFFGGSIPGYDGNFHIISLPDSTIQSFYLYPDNIEYDFIRNRLVYEKHTGFYYIDLNTMKNVFLSETGFGSIVYGQARTYIPQKNQYVYIDYGNDTLYYFVLDANTGETVCQTEAEKEGLYYYSAGNLVTNIYNGDIIGNNEGCYGIVDPCNGTITKLSTVSDYDAQLNNQMAVFNIMDSTYVLPYYATNAQTRYAVIDVYSDSILEIFDQPWQGKMNLQQIYDQPFAPLIFYHDTLFAPYGKHYKWYKNDTLISETDVNYIVPKHKAVYKAEVEFAEYTTMSQTIEVTPSFTYSNKYHNIKVYPNPTSGYFHVSTQGEKINNIVLYDIGGKQVYKNSPSQKDMITVNISNLDRGSYIIIIKSKSQTYKQLIIKE